MLDAVRAAVAGGDWTRVPFAADVVLETSNEDGRSRIEGAAAVTAHLSRPGPGEVLHWDGEAWPPGAAVSFEWRGASGTDRRRWYLRTDPGGAITELFSVAARPAVAAAGTPPVPPAALLERLGVDGVETLSHGGNSGAALVRGGGHVFKRIAFDGGDWLARVTRDRGRTAQLHAAGVFDAMPASVGHGIVGVERDGDAAWIAMRDVQALLLPDGARLSREQSRQVLAAAADLHRAFRGKALPGAASLADRIGMSTPAVAEAERPHPDLLPKQFEQGWEAFVELVDRDVAAAVLQRVGQPTVLADAMLRAHGATTLLHGDLRGDNLGLDGDRLILIDWDLATAGTPTAEFAWYLAHSARRIDATRDEVEADYRALEDPDPVELELGLVSGLVQYGWRIAHSARIHPDPAETAWGRAELEWWVPRVRAALERV